ncbi:MAG: hypothetical protein JRI22_17135 [Deltaproteobacteria bacterium]|nr:hypothetical protein [Deltaproteobacteria bacterium]
MDRLMVPGRGAHRAKPLVASRPGRQVVRAIPTNSSSIIGGNLTVISLINMLLIKVDNSIKKYAEET